MEVFIAKGENKDSVVKIPTSKSLSHRALLAASLHQGTSIIEDLVQNKDTEATMRVLKSLGASIETKGNKTYVQGVSSLDKKIEEVLDCGESGSTLRFMIPLFGLMQEEVSFTGHGRLMDRPQDVYEKIFKDQNLLFENQNHILKIKGPLKSGTYEIAGNISSQFITGLLFSLPLLNGDSVLHILPPYESKSYVKMSEDVLRKAGIEIVDEGETIYIKGNQTYQSIEMKIDGDDSQAAFFACLSQTKQEKITIDGMNPNSKQGDHEVINILKNMGAQVEEHESSTVIYPHTLRGCEIDLADCPDLGPVLFALASIVPGTTTFTNASRLRIKESDRIACMEEELKKLGCNIFSTFDTVTIQGIDEIKGNVHLNGHNDHRIVMALSVLLSSSSVGGYIDEAEAISKSYPNFFEDLEKCGVEVKKYD